MEKNVQLKYRLYRRRNGRFLLAGERFEATGNASDDRQTRSARRLLNAMNESHRAADPQPQSRSRVSRRARPEDGHTNWQAVMDEMATHGIPSTQERCARGFRSKATIRSEINRSCKRPATTCSRSCTRTETASLTICDDFTTWPLISVGSRGPSSPNEHGPKSEAKAKSDHLML